MHRFPDITGIALPERFTDPFRYSPHPLVQTAAGLLIGRIEASEHLSEMLAEGKMLGVLIVSEKDGQIGYLAAFSGNVQGHSQYSTFWTLQDISRLRKQRSLQSTRLSQTQKTVRG